MAVWMHVINLKAAVWIDTDNLFDPFLMHSSTHPTIYYSSPKV